MKILNPQWGLSMGNRSAHNRWIILVTLACGVLLQILPLTSSIAMIKPNWLLLILSYWIIALPQGFGIGTAFVLGLLVDLFSGTVLGVNAFAFCVVAYIAQSKFQLIRNLALWQQCIVIVFLSLCYDSCIFILEIIINHAITFALTTFLSEIINGAIWVAIFLSLRYVRRRFHVH